MKKSIIIIVSIILLFFVTTSLFMSYGIYTYVVNGQSMEPTLHNTAVGSADKIFYKWVGLKRFDIIVVRIDDQDWMKRLIGRPNETIYYNEGHLYINDEAVEEDFLSAQARTSTCAPYYERDDENQLILKTPNICQPGGVHLNEDEYFFMGDNRAESYDSRRFSQHIHKTNIIARPFIHYGTCSSFDHYGNCLKVNYYFPRFIGAFL